MNEIILGQDEILYNIDDEDKRLFIISKGEIEFFINKEERIWNLGTLKV